MGKKISFILILFALSSLILATPSGRTEQELISDGKVVDARVPADGQTGKVSMDFESASLKDILKAFSRQTGISFIANDTIENKKITVFLNGVSIKEALSSILDANGFLYEKQEGNVYLIKPGGKAAIRTITKVYRLNYIQVYKMSLPSEPTASTSNITIIGQPAIAEAGSTAFSTANAPAASEPTSGKAGQAKNIIEVIRSLMSRYGKIVADRRNNSLIITDIPDVFENIEQTIKQLDVEPIQIMIQAEIIETTTDALKRIGLEYGSSSYLAKITYTGQSSTSKPSFPTPFPFTENFIKDVYNTNLAASGLFKYGIINISDTDIVLKALAQDDDTKYLSRPRIMTINNESAIISVSANTAIGITSSSVTQTGQSITTAERAETGIVLKVTPQVNDKGDIFMFIEPSVARAQASAFFSTQFMDPSYRSSSSTVMVRDGDTVVVGGLIQSNNFKTTRKIPILGDIPILGEPFKSRYREAVDTELLIFITPHVVKKRDLEYIVPEKMTDREYMIKDVMDRYSAQTADRKNAMGDRQGQKNSKDREEAMNKALVNYSKGAAGAGPKKGIG